ncbi:FBD-associated F-box protein At2g26860-like [Solanum stenotomum]|uniref:FBD-associated F-box protein At2g26860-like n=1 Tax=Solanum stenotomum TaxID=172797 RepID=UPI0020D1D078|nr:FBD-associated F-box protein At2g26860-like [Solanum stenotomum]
METSTMNEIDRISSLPVDILHNILSNLCIFDVIHMSVLSKRWKYICTIIPYFRFDSSYCTSLLYSNLEKFKEFMYTFLISQNTINLVRYTLTCSDMLESTYMLRLMHAATRRNVQQLVLLFWHREPFELPNCLVTCESLQVLKLNLYGDVLKLPNHFDGFRQLKFLHLCCVKLSDEHLTNCLFSKCQLLENLELIDCNLKRMKLLYIDSASLLYITFLHGDYYDNCEIKISCPALKFLKCKCEIPKDIVIKNLFSIEYVDINFQDNDVKCDDFGFSFEKTGILVHKMIKEVPSISVLKLCKVSLKGLYEEIRQVRLSPICFNKLKSLKLKLGVDEDHMQVMIQLLKYSPNLEVLKLWCDEDGEWRENSLMYYEWCDFWPAREDQGRGHEVFHPTPLGKKLHCTYKMHDPEESIVCLDSHLKSIQLIGFKDEENEIELLRFFLKNARVLEKLTIVWAGYALKSEEALKKVLNIPRTSSQVLLAFHDAKLKQKSTNWLDYC